MAKAPKKPRSKDGRFAEGNNIWTLRKSHGRTPIFETPDELWKACCEYFDWVVKHPLFEERAFAYQAEVVLADVTKIRAMTIAGLCNFLGITQETWNDWRKRRSDLSEIISQVEAVIWQQKFEGAAAGLLNANIISRELGLAEKREHSGADGEPFEREQLSKLEVARQIAFILAEAAEHNPNQPDNS